MHYSNYNFHTIKRLLILLAFGVLNSCGNSVGKPELLNGYWEIRAVEFPDGQQKEYLANSTVDFFQLTGREGFRKKVHPQANGTFQTSDDAAPLRIVQQEGTVFLLFEQEEGSWQEEVLKLTDSELITRHDNGLKYTYERHNPLPLANGTK